MCLKFLLLFSIILLVHSGTTDDILDDGNLPTTTPISINITLNTFVKKEFLELSDEALTIVRDILKGVLAFLSKLTCSYPLIERGLASFSNYINKTENLSDLNSLQKLFYLMDWNAISNIYYYDVKEQQNAAEMLLYATFQKIEIEKRVHEFQARLADFFIRYEIVADYYWSSMTEDEQALKKRLCAWYYQIHLVEIKNGNSKAELHSVLSKIFQLYRYRW